MSGILESAMGALGYVPVNLGEAQINQESGGRQTDRKGRPVTSKAGAIGVAQVMPETAKAMAKSLGIPWDENKYKTDRDYNMRLGDHYQGQMDKQFGKGTVEALAAYNAGPGNGRDGRGVLGAKQRAAAAGRPNDWFSFLPGETQDYVTKIRGGTPAAGGGMSGLTIPDILRDQGRTEGSGPTVSQVYNPNSAAGTISQDFQETRDRGQIADDVLTNAITEMKGIQQEQTQQLAARNERTDAVLDEQAFRTNEMLQRVQPLFQQRAAIDEQRQKLTTMNPLERAFRGLFDLNYDKSHIEEVGAGIDAQLQTMGKEYDTVIGLQDRLLKIVDQSFQGQEAAGLLQLKHLDQNIEIAAKSFSMASDLWNVDLKGLDSDRSLRAQQLELTQQVLSQLTPGQISTYHAQAKKSENGIITINGAQVSEGQLLQAGQGFAEQQVRLDQMSMAAAAQNAALKDRAEDDLIGAMTTTQIRSAIQNGGQYQGQTLSLDKLGAGLQRSMGRDNAMVQGTMTEDSTAMLSNMTSALANSNRLAGMRAVQMTGGQPQALLNLANSQAPQLNAMAAKIRETKDPAQRQVLAQQYTQMVQGFGQQQAKVIEGVADTWAGNNKALKPLAMAFLTGAPLNGEDSAKGIISLVRSGGSMMANMSPEARAAFNAAKGVIGRYDRQANQPGQNPFAQQQKGKERDAAMLRDVQTAITQSYTNSQFNTVIRSAPQIAKQINHLGQKLDPTVVRQAIDSGDNEGYRRMGVALGLTVDETKRMFATPGGGEQWTKVASRANGATFEQLQVKLGITQSMMTSQYLDQNHPRIGKYAAGAVYANLLASPRFADAVGTMTQQQGQQGFGDFVVSSMGQGGVTGQVAQYGQIALSGYNQLNQNRHMQAALKAQDYNNDPLRKTAVILGAIPGLQPNEEQALLRAVTPIYQAARREGPSAGGALAGAADFSGTYSGQRSFDAIRTAIMTQKFQDPGLEKIRQRAAQHFDEYSRVTDAAFDRFGNYTPEESE